MSRPTHPRGRPQELRDRRIRSTFGAHTVSVIEMDKNLAGPCMDGGPQCSTAHGEIRRPGYRLKKLATGFGLVCPHVDSIRVFGGSGTSRSAAAAFANRVSCGGDVAYEADPATMLHQIRSYLGFHPRAMPADMMQDAV